MKRSILSSCHSGLHACEDKKDEIAINRYVGSFKPWGICKRKLFWCFRLYRLGICPGIWVKDNHRN